MPAGNPAQWTIPAALEELASDGDFSLVVELIDTFVEDTDQKTGLLILTAEIDLAKAAAIGHSIKGAARQMNLPDFGEAAFELEIASADELKTRIAGLIAAWPQARAIILRAKANMR